MNKIAKYAFVVGALFAPVLSFAQQADGAVTRSQVRADLVRVEQAGYSLVGSSANYPDDILAADAKIAAEDAQVARLSGMGGEAPAGASGSGGPRRVSSSSPANACVGPASYCNLYFGG